MRTAKIKILIIISLISQSSFAANGTTDLDIWKQSYENSKKGTPIVGISDDIYVGEQTKSLSISTNKDINNNLLVEVTNPIVEKDSINNEQKDLNSVEPIQQSDIADVNKEVPIEFEQAPVENIDNNIINPQMEVEGKKTEIQLDNQVTDEINEVVTQHVEYVCMASALGFQQSFTLFDGTCPNGMPNGNGKAVGASGNYKGEFRNGQFDGQGRLYLYKSGETYEGTFLNGLRHGQGYIVDKSTGINRLAEFENDVFVRWLENNIVTDYSSFSSSVSAPNVTPSYTNTGITNNVYLGKNTPYGKIVGMQGNFVSVETTFYDKDGYRRTAVRDYPLSMFLK